MQQHLRKREAQAAEAGGGHDQAEAQHVELGLAPHQQRQPSHDDAHDAHELQAGPGGGGGREKKAEGSQVVRSGGWLGDEHGSVRKGVCEERECACRLRD